MLTTKKVLFTAVIILTFLIAFALGSNSFTKESPPPPDNSAVTPPTTTTTTTTTAQSISKTTPEPKGETAILSGKIICLDPGHQSSSDLTEEPVGPGSPVVKIKDGGGATGINSRTPEHKIVLGTSLLLKSKLEAAGAKVIMTRTTGDVKIGNVERATIANKADADLYIRIHCDGNNNPMVSGTSVLYPAKNNWTAPIYEESKKAAQMVQDQLVKSCNRKDNGIVARDDITGFNWSKVPVILVEIAFLSNPEEDQLLNTDEFRAKAAEGMYLGVVDYFQY